MSYSIICQYIFPKKFGPLKLGVLQQMLGCGAKGMGTVAIKLILYRQEHREIRKKTYNCDTENMVGRLYCLNEVSLQPANLIVSLRTVV